MGRLIDIIMKRTMGFLRFYDGIGVLWDGWDGMGWGIYMIC